MEINAILLITDFILFVLFALSVGYLLIFAIASIRRSDIIYPESKELSKILVLFPAYREDSVIISSIESFMNQEYPATHFDVVVISDNMTRETNEKLKSLPIKVCEVTYQNSTKAKALKAAMESIGDTIYDIVIVMDADNTAETNFLSKINDAYCFGSRAMQAHRVAKNLNTDTAILDAISEEINNSIFRKGHVNMGVASALIGSGMAFDFSWFKENIKKIKNLPEERELEILLLRQGIFIDYLEGVKVFDEKIQKDSAFFKQRRRWLASQFDTLKTVLHELPGALFSLNISFADKILSWMLLPRVILLGVISIFALAISFINIVNAYKWWILLLVLLFTFALSTPDYLVTKKSVKAMKRVPVLFVMMFLNLFRLKGVNNKWIPTEKNFK